MSQEKQHSIGISSFIQRFVLILLLCLFSLVDAKSTTLTISGSITITISTGSAAAEPAAVSASTTTLNYNNTSTRRVKKITINATIVRKFYDLKAHAINMQTGGGTAQAAVDLTTITAATDFIRDIPVNSGAHTCNVQYTATARYEDGYGVQNGGDTIYTITYTIVNQ